MRTCLVNIQRLSTTVTLSTTRSFTSTTARMSENYSAKPTGSGGMSGSTTTPANANIGHDKPKVFDAEGSIGKHFTEQGAIGGTAQKVGGPLDKQGAIGKQFTTDGSIGGTVQDKLGGQTKKSN